MQQATSHSADWNVLIDFNQDGKILSVMGSYREVEWSSLLNTNYQEALTLYDCHGDIFNFDSLRKKKKVFLCSVSLHGSRPVAMRAEVKLQTLLRLELSSIDSFLEEFNSLRESESRFRSLYDHLSEGVLICDSTGKFVEWNKAACLIYNRPDFEGMTVFELFPHNTIEQNDWYWKSFMDSGVIEGFYRFNTDQGLRYIEFTGKANVFRGMHLVVFSDLTEKKNTEKALLQSQANLKTIFDYSDQNILLINPDYTVIAANPAAQKVCFMLFGKEMELPCNVLDYVIDKELFVHEFERAKTGQHVVSERLIKPQANNDIWMEFNFLPIIDNKGSVKSICYTAKDISSRKRKAIVLENSERRFRQLAENSPDIIYIIDLSERKITYINRPHIFGYESTEMLGPEIWRDIVHPDDVEYVESHWTKFLTRNNNKVGSLEYRLRTKDKHYEWVNNRHLIVERNENKEPLKVLLNVTIITERKQAEQALIESESKLTSLIENTSDLVWSIDTSYSLTASNSAFKNLIRNNYQIELTNGDNLIASIKDIEKDGWLELHKSALKGKRVTAEFSWFSETRENLFYEITYNPIMDSLGEVIGVSVFARDITQRKLNEAVIIQTNFELDSFVYRASHDLRAPLRSILGLTSIIRTEANETEKKRYLGLIEKSAHKLDNFISDLINFSRNSRLAIEVEEVDFALLLSEAKEHLRFMEDAERVNLREDIRLAAPFYSDSKRILIFLNNLLSNAIKYQSYHTDRKPFVQVQILGDQEKVSILIEDNGIGIQKEYLPRIFEMFFRASEKSFGSGLGLYIVKQTVEKLGGSITVSSQPNKGTRFEIILPNRPLA
ncbi:MAG: PAS domain S-box protein [Cytophagaceae bacterium]|jgi:PAS domain S-box-containing protein|nr:PAS domain S-box protein [Cytophagaceae bacterium]